MVLAPSGSHKYIAVLFGDSHAPKVPEYIVGQCHPLINRQHVKELTFPRDFLLTASLAHSIFAFSEFVDMSALRC